MTVRLERSEAIATITLDRPAKRNALSPNEHHALQEICVALRADFQTRVVVLTGAGSCFSAGADLDQTREEGKPANDLERRHRARIGDRTVAAIEALDQITIAAINGPCVGGGAVLALACDLRVIERDAWIRVPEVELGLPLTWGALPLLVREIGPARTIEVVTTCERIDAEQALAWGLVNHVAPGAALDLARDIAERMVRQPAVPVAMTKSVVRALRAGARQGDVVETDGDLYWLGIRLGGLRRPERKTGPGNR
jgi:enoyl-CoA hydratase/carnithine racemase